MEINSSRVPCLTSSSWRLPEVAFGLARKLIYLGCALFTARGMGRPGVGALHNLVGLAGLGYHPAACPCEKPGLSTYQLALGPSGNRSTALLPVLY